MARYVIDYNWIYLTRGHWGELIKDPSFEVMKNRAGKNLASVRNRLEKGKSIEAFRPDRASGEGCQSLLHSLANQARIHRFVHYNLRQALIGELVIDKESSTVSKLLEVKHFV